VVLPVHDSYPDLATAMKAIVPSDARVVGFGELHNRNDVASRSTLKAFTDSVLPVFADQFSDLVVETWIVDPKCGQHAVETTKTIETAVARPAATKSDIALLADAARADGIQPHAMTLTCADYDAISHTGSAAGSAGGGSPLAGSGAEGRRGSFDAAAMLTLETRELQRIAVSAVAHRDHEPKHRPLIALYGGALHNDRFPASDVGEWSYAAAVDKASGDHYVEIDLMMPELAAADKTTREQPWFPLAASPSADVAVWKRGERSFVVVLPAAAHP
jgi:hypothetical protein